STASWPPVPISQRRHTIGYDTESRHRCVCNRGGKSTMHVYLIRPGASVHRSLRITRLTFAPTSVASDLDALGPLRSERSIHTTSGSPNSAPLVYHPRCITRGPASSDPATWDGQPKVPLAKREDAALWGNQVSDGATKCPTSVGPTI